MNSFRGDLSQMASQYRFLRERGYPVKTMDVYPVLESDEDYKRAITSIWFSRVEGWWHYEKKLVEWGVCSQGEYDIALGRA